MSLVNASYVPARNQSMRPRARLTLSTNSITNATIGLVVFLGGFVFVEPAPYELVIMPLLVIWFACGLTLKRTFLPLTFFMLCFVCGGAIAATQKADIGSGFFYITVTGFLATTSIFFAAIIADRPQERLRIIFKAYVTAAVIGALIGILAYFRAIPGSETFIFGGRARGPFEDPNVFGPFLVLPTIFLLRNALVKSFSESFWSVLGLLLLLSAIFLAFSRAAWGLALFSCTLMTFIVYATAPNQKLRNKIILISILMVFATIGLLIFALSLDAISGLFSERAKLVQNYDSARFGRFARYTYGLQWIMETPLGFGFGKFRSVFGEDTHNVYIKAFLVYGWLGGISYLLLVSSTLIVGFKHLFLNRPWRAYFQCCYIVISGHCLVGLVVDTDRWRHLYLIYGLAWGMMAANTIWKRRMHHRTLPAQYR